MRNVRLERYDGLPVDVLPIGTDYPPDHLLAHHAHRRAQLLYGATGIMQVETLDGSWTIPTNRAVLIPPQTSHQVRMRDVTTWSLYIEPSAVPWWPASCTVIEVEPLLRELLREANDFDAGYDASGRDGAVVQLILQELQRVTPLPLSVSLPRAEPFRSLCTEYLGRPDVALTNVDWARAAMMSTRNFDRRFREATGMSPSMWRTRARLLASITLLRRMPVAQVAGDLGYASPASFTAAFTRTFGAPPSSFHERRTPRSQTHG
ncbi:AraC family transcriptional regulator [Microbacterium oxydans]|uniref:AraC family transcriptional regulator n=1 Tax=Microbacterium oxydans TaxID=82380 RepID=UPI00226B88B3|nr:helix-turn-helix transcriptional regulator [Microbacterium oxydans]WAA65570.1 helix-turn-helix transcriptional regulator [Microbacterium oxydans]